MHGKRKVALGVLAIVAIVGSGITGAALAGGSNDASASRGADVITQAIAPNAQAALFADGTEKIRFKNIQGDIDNPAVGVLCVNVKDTIKVGKSVPIVSNEWGDGPVTQPNFAFWNQTRNQCPAGEFEIRTFDSTGSPTNGIAYTFVIP
jgi:hypothetical protein